MSKLEGKVALVTGGSSGIGLATAQRFVREGAYVFITGRRQPELDAARDLISQTSTDQARLGGSVSAIRADASDLDDLDRLFATIEQEKGHLDIVFANAGVGTFAPLGAITEENFDATFNTNVKGVLFTAQKALPLMPEGATIILNASIASIKGMPAFSVYSATKAAIRSFARNLDRGPQGAQDPRKRHQPRHRTHAGLRPAGPDRRAGQGLRFFPGGCHSSWTGRDARRDRQGGRVPRLGRKQLRQRHRAVCGRRHGSDLNAAGGG